jgi:hypothetical protein
VRQEIDLEKQREALGVPPVRLPSYASEDLFGASALLARNRCDISKESVVPSKRRALARA